MIYGNDLRSCPGCRHYDQGGTDHDTGYSAPAHCEVAGNLLAFGDCTEAVAGVLESILFQLSVLNNCPLREEARRSIGRITP